MLRELNYCKYRHEIMHANVRCTCLSDVLFPCSSCPKCSIQAELPSTQMIFKCPDVDCALETCRKCLEPAHIPLKCSEVERGKSETQGRLKVEEAITAAKIRTCPKLRCGTKFVKSDGCNRMTCPKCQTWSCYVCRALIPEHIDYKHFCQTPHCRHKNCKKCVLFSKVEEDDARAMSEAGLQAAEEVRGQSLLSGDHVEVSVDVESIIKDGVPRRGR
jgi:TRIAD3 protein (E3 ubiquitin-protein ligase RNF216)